MQVYVWPWRDLGRHLRLAAHDPLGHVRHRDGDEVETHDRLLEQVSAAVPPNERHPLATGRPHDPRSDAPWIGFDRVHQAVLFLETCSPGRRARGEVAGVGTDDRGLAGAEDREVQRVARDLVRRERVFVLREEVRVRLVFLRESFDRHWLPCPWRPFLLPTQASCV